MTLKKFNKAFLELTLPFIKINAKVKSFVYIEIN